LTCHIAAARGPRGSWRTCGDEAARQVMPVEASVTWPIPYRANDTTHLIMPFYICLAQPTQSLAFPWLGAFTQEWQTGKLVEYIDYRFKSAWAKMDLTKPVGSIPSATQELSRRALVLAAMYDELLDTMTVGGSLPPFWGREFRDHLALLVPEVHHRFYQHVAPKFFDRFLKLKD
jgi:hypothetical protein